MKKFLLSVSAIAAMLFAGSCQKEAFNPVSAGDVAVKLAIELPTQVETKAMSQAETTDIVYYEIWNSDWSKQLYPVNNDALASEVVQNKKATLELTLVSDQTYNFIFWAQNAACGAYDVNELKNVEVDYDVIANPGNQDKFDAFYAVKTITVNGAINETVTLYRPFAQLNFGTTRMESSFGPVEVGATEITVSQLATVFNTLEGVGENQTGAVTFMAEDLATSEMLKTNGQSYTWVTMDYMLMMNEQDVVEVTASFDLGMDVPVEHLVANVPLKKNYRTNIVGDLFTADAVLNIIVDPAFLQPDEVITAGVAEEIVPVDGVYNVEKPGHILWLSKQSNEDVSVFSGKTIRFAADIDMMGQGFLPIQLNPKNSVKIEGQGHKVYNFSVRADDYRNPETGKTVGEAAGLFGSVKGSITDLHVEDVLVESNHYAGALVGYIYGSVKNCSARNVEIVSTPYYSIKDGMFVYDEANNVGGLVGYVGEHGTGYVISDNLVDNATITAYRSVGGLVGTIQTNAKVDNNTVSNITINVDQTYKPYFEAPKAAQAGKVVGRAISKDDLTDNTATDVVITGIYTVATAAELQKVLDENTAPNYTLIKFTADLAGDVTVKQAEGENIVIDGCDYKYDGTITVNGDARAAGAETLTFTGINFETATDGITFISAPSKINGRYNYSHNVTIEGCTFKGNHTVGSASFTGTFNLAMMNCVANNMHSILQVQSCDNEVLVENVTVNNGKNGVSFGNTAYPTLKNSTINAAAYGVRADGDASRGNLVIENSTITANLPVVVRKVTTDGYAVALNGGALETTGGYDVVFTKGSDDAAFVAPEVDFTITGADDYIVFPYQHAVFTAAELQAVLDAATSDLHVVFAADLVGNVTVLQKEGVNVLVEGNGKKYDGTITVNGNARSTGAETLTFTGINFETATDGITFISAPSKINGRYNYSHNVTIEGCTFKGNHTVGSASFTGTYNLAMMNCVANNMHSILQVQSCDNEVLVENVTVNNGKNGVSFGNTAYPTLKNSTINAAAYGVRADGDASRGNLIIENSTITANLPVVVRKVTTDGYAVALNGGSLETISGYDVVFTKGSDDAAFVAPEASFSISGADNYVVFPGKFAARTADDLQAILDAATSDVYVVLAADIRGNATVDQKEGVNVVIDGQKNKFDGTIYVNGHSRSNGAETLTIKNVDFESATVVDFISSNSSSDGKIRYAHNVAVEGCSFVGTAADAVAIRTRQAYNISVKNCTAELGHSFAQLASTAGFYAEGVTVDAPRGFNLGNSNTEATFVDCDITATKGDGYGIRFDNGAVLNVTGCAVSAYEPVVFRNNTAACQFNLSASTLTAAGGYEVVVESGAAPVMTGVDGLNVKNN